jgi:flagellar P-ring protein precursor FlgI
MRVNRVKAARSIPGIGFEEATDAQPEKEEHEYIPPSLEAGRPLPVLRSRYWFDKQRFVSMVQQLPVEASSRARVVVNEATGTIIIGGDVKLSPDVALAHANLSITTGETPEVSQPLPFSQGETAVVPRTEITVEEESNSLSVIKENATVADLAQALNALGVTPRDLGMIFLNLRAQGALRAELIIK